MVPMTSLLIPIVLSAVLVFIASSVIHMALGYHASDLRKAPDEGALMEALGRFNLPPGDYGVPKPASASAMRDPEFIAKREKGPVAFMTIVPGGPVSMGKSMAQWFAYSVVVSACAAYLAGRALGPGAPYLHVFRFAGTAAFLAYAMALPQNSIWWRRNWSMTLKTMFDGLVYGALVGGTFGWLWPR